jgi:zinc transport system substrate-binding protein
LRPSEVAAIEKADIIFWIGPELNPTLYGALNKLSPNAQKIALLSADKTRLWPYRGKDHQDLEERHQDHDDHGHEKHDTHGHGHDDHDDHGHEKHAAHQGHDHGDIDPHIWLDPDNALYWLQLIAEILAQHDPDNREIYQANAMRARAELTQEVNHIKERLSDVDMPPIFMRHDAYQYFEKYFGLTPKAYIHNSENQAPSPAHIARLHDMTKTMNYACLISEGPVDTNIIDTLFEGVELTVIQANPSGISGVLDHTAYIKLITALGYGLDKCANNQP